MKIRKSFHSASLSSRVPPTVEFSGLLPMVTQGAGSWLAVNSNSNRLQAGPELWSVSAEDVRGRDCFFQAPSLARI